MKLLAEVTLTIDDSRMEQGASVERIVARAIDYTIDANIDGQWGIDVTWSDIRITVGEE